MSEIEDLKRRAGITENDAVANVRDEAWQAIYAANQQLRQIEGSDPAIQQARELFGQGLDIMSRGGAWR